MSSINFTRGIESADYLNALRKELTQSMVKTTKSTSLLEYILNFFNSVNISNSMTLSSVENSTGYLVDTAKVDMSITI